MFGGCGDLFLQMANDFRGTSDELKPREQLMRAASVSDVSDDALLAILLKTGVCGCDVVELSRRLISAFGSLRLLVNSDWRHLQERIADHNEKNPSRRILGVGLVKCLELAAAFELGKRGSRLTYQDLTKAQVKTPADAYAVFSDSVPASEGVEAVFVLPLDSRNRPICAPIRVTTGSVGSVPVEPVAIFREAVRWNARSVVVAHTHPSGDPQPSQEDIDVTVRLKEAAKVVGVNFLDHLVLGSPDSADGRGFVSIEELGAL